MVLAATLAGTAVKAGVLIWAYIRTRKPATIAYAGFVLLQSVLPYVLIRNIGVERYSTYASWSYLIEIILFLWLIVSLISRKRSPTEIMND